MQDSSQDFPSDSQISIIEDLDPEPEEKGQRSKRLELVLGVVVVLAVLGWVSFTWADQQHKTAEYSAAEQALARQDWDGARSHFLAAGTYRDASERAKTTEQTIDKRDKQYAVCTLSASSGQWATSLQAARTVEQIQPGFRDTGQLMAEAKKQVYRQAVSGTLALRTNTRHPGIYYRTADDWQWLTGSDRFSEVLGAGTSGQTVYDAPGPKWTPPTSRNLGQARLYGRKLMAASLQDGKVTTRELAFDPAVYGFYVWGAEGVWAIRYSFRQPKDLRFGRMDSLYAPYAIEYQAWDNNNVSTLDLPGPDWFVMDLGRDGAHALMVEMAGNDSGESKLYLADATGSNRKLLYTFQGDIESARFSADGRYALVSGIGYKSYTNVEGVTQDIALVSLGGQPSVRNLVQKSQVVPCPADDCNMASAVFLDKGTLAGKIILGEWEAETGVIALTLLDPDEPDNELAALFVPGGPPAFSEPAWVNQPPDGSSVTISWSSGTENRMTVVVLRPLGRASVAKVEWPNASNISWKVVRNNHLLSYTFTVSSTPIGDNSRYGIYGLSLDNLDDATAPNELLNEQSSIPDRFSVSTSWYAGDALLSYLKGNSLHARSYDGQVDVPLESGVSKIFYLPFTELSYLR